MIKTKSSFRHSKSTIYPFDYAYDLRHLPTTTYKHAFTIVELLIVMVIIAILATLTIVAYTGIQQKAIVASINSDLDNASRSLKLFQVENNDNYPLTNDCSSTPAANSVCLKSSPGNNYTVFETNNSGARSFCITIKNDSINAKYHITEASAPEPGVCPFSFATTLLATTASSTSIDLAWDAVDDATSYTLEQATNSDFTDDLTTIAVQPDTSFTSISLSQGTTYYYRVNATIDGDISDWSNTDDATTTIDVRVLVVAGGGGGGNASSGYSGGGGGAGGLIYNASYSINPGSISVTVGNGGNAGATTSGENSVFETLTAIGGGRGAAWNLVNLVGGSGGGGSSQYNWPSVAGTSGQGNASSGGYGAEYHMAAGGGGGAGAAAYDCACRPATGKPGGAGSDYSSVFGTSVGVNGFFAGGGAGGGNGDTGVGTGGTGGGGNGSTEGTAPGSPGVINTGGGGGGGGGTYWSQLSASGGAGGSGIVLVAYPTGSITASGGTTYTYGSNTIHKFTTSGTFTASGP